MENQKTKVQNQPITTCHSRKSGNPDSLLSLRERSRVQGFTLLEILITLTLTFLVFIMVYRTFYTSYTVASTVDKNLDSSEATFKFLQSFQKEVTSIVENKIDTEISSETFGFICQKPGFTYPVKVIYSVELAENESRQLQRKQENIIFDYTFSFSVVDHAENIYFSYYNGSEWVEYWENEKKFPSAVALNLKINGNEIFFPVNIYCE